MAQGAYVFGYGSLIEKESRTRTNPEAADARPARLTGYQRGWFHQFANNVGSTCTFLGAIEKPGITTNGVIYHVNDFEKTKERETGYTATPVPA
ncbi:MAG TPA: gamma-glutamylcyclotransferase family protein, partial [Terriglobales bacterium]|nr:gamma-glutamylcyclotransferase family protein [Terriglobales bacterium]